MNLPEEIILKIYKYKHELEFIDVLRELMFNELCFRRFNNMPLSVVLLNFPLFVRNNYF